MAIKKKTRNNFKHQQWYHSIYFETFIDISIMKKGEVTFLCSAV